MDATSNLADAMLGEQVAPAPPIAPSPTAEAVPAQFLCGAHKATCPKCGASCWSVVTKSAPTTIRYARRTLPPTRRLVQDDGQTRHADVCVRRSA